MSNGAYCTTKWVTARRVLRNEWRRTHYEMSDEYEIVTSIQCLFLLQKIYVRQRLIACKILHILLHWKYCAVTLLYMGAPVEYKWMRTFFFRRTPFILRALSPRTIAVGWVTARTKTRKWVTARTIAIKCCTRMSDGAHKIRKWVTARTISLEWVTAHEKIRKWVTARTIQTKTSVGAHNFWRKWVTERSNL